MNKIFEDFFDDIETEVSDNITDQIESEELSSDNINDISDTKLDIYNCKLKITIGGINKSTGKSGLTKNISKFKRFENILKYILDNNRYVNAISDIIFKIDGENWWVDKDYTGICNVEGFYVNNKPSDLDGETFFKKSKVHVNLSLELKIPKTPKDVYNILKMINDSFEIAINCAWKKRTYIDYIIISYNKTPVCGLSSNVYSSMIKKSPNYKEQFFNCVGAMLGDKMRYESTLFYDDENITKEMYEIYRYAGILDSNITKKFDDNTKTLTVDISNSLWESKKDVHRLIAKIKSIGYDLKITSSSGYAYIIANSEKDIRAWESVLVFPLNYIRLNIPAYDISGWNGKSVIDMTKWKINNLEISPSIGTNSSNKPKPVYPKFKTAYKTYFLKK